MNCLYKILDCFFIKKRTKLEDVSEDILDEKILLDSYEYDNLKFGKIVIYD